LALARRSAQVLAPVSGLLLGLAPLPGLVPVRSRNPDRQQV